MSDTPRTDEARYFAAPIAFLKMEEMELEFAAVTSERDGLQRAYDAALRQMNEAIAKAEWLRTDRVAELERKLAAVTAERDYWKKQHDRILHEYQHRLMTIVKSAFESTACPEECRCEFCNAIMTYFDGWHCPTETCEANSAS